MNDTLNYLRSTQAIRERSKALYDLNASGNGCFTLHDDRLPAVADFVVEVTRRQYPNLDIPFHCRSNHLRVGGVDRLAGLDSSAMFDLILVSVLLDAGAGPNWSFESDGKTYGRSEGLAVASADMFASDFFGAGGAFAKRLVDLSEPELSDAFQVSDSNPLLGLSGRCQLLNALGQNLLGAGFTRPSDLLGPLPEAVTATHILHLLLDQFSSIWPSRLSFEGQPLGDVWHHSALGSAGDPDSFVPFHKLSQWLTYSLIEAVEHSGRTVTEVNALTGLPEYRNGGLLLDMGLISLKDPDDQNKAHRAESELIIEWRALTIVYLDQIADLVRTQLGLDEIEFPLAKVLEGGTWQAGRELAAERGGLPPLTLDSDGTVF